MTQQTYDWSDSKVIDDVQYEEADAKAFRQLLNAKEEGTEEGSTASMTVGEILKGIIVELSKDFVVVDVGLKSEGLIPVSEFDDMEEVGLGNEVEVYLDQAEGSDGQIVLSREKARRQRQWEHIINHCEEGSIVRGKVMRKVKGGLMVDIGMEAFLPGSQIDNKRIKNIDEFVGKSYDFKILKINIERKNIVVSRRELLEEERVSKKAELLDNIEVGDLRTGVVKNITDFGVFLDLDGIDGLLHITDMTWKRIKHPSEMVALGDELEVMILHVDQDKGRVALGLKQKEENPWEEIEEKFPVGTIIRGKIVNLVPYGAFIEIEPGIEGLIHVSEMSWVKNVTDPSEVVNKGDEVEAIVLSIQKDEGKISLGIKQTEQNPWEDAAEKFPVGTIVKAEIRNLTNYGAFVELAPGIDGLIHISDLSWTKKVSHPSEMLEKGDMVEAIVLSVDTESKKITLGVKQLSDNPWETIEKTMPVGSDIQGTVVKTTAFGAFVELENGMEGLVHVTELSDESFGKVEDIVGVGDKVTAQVLRIDPENKRSPYRSKIASSRKKDTAATTSSSTRLKRKGMTTMNKDLLAIFEYLEREKASSERSSFRRSKNRSRWPHAAVFKAPPTSLSRSIPKPARSKCSPKKEIVEDVEHPEEEITLEEAQEIDPDCEIGQWIHVSVTPEDFGRIAAQTARQVIAQKLRSAERDVIYDEFKHRIGELVSGTVKRIGRGGTLIVDLGKVEAILPDRFFPREERYHVGERVQALLFEVRETENGGAEVVLTRSHPEFVAALFAQEVPELNDGTIEIRAIVREAGYRTKLAVSSNDMKVDPLGACVGVRGTRVKNIIREVNNEKIDIIPFSEDPETLLRNALDPIEVKKLEYDEKASAIRIIVADDDYPAVLGKRGMNARLNGRLIGEELIIRKESEYAKELQIQRLELSESDDPTLDEELELDGVNALILANLKDAGFDTLRKLFTVSAADLAREAAISPEMAEDILEKARKKRT